MIVFRGAFLDGDPGGGEPVQVGGEPGLDHGLFVRCQGGGAAEHQQRVDDRGEAARVEHAGGIAAVALVAEADLGVFQMRVHPRGRCDEPCAQPPAGPAGGGFITVQVPRSGEFGDVVAEIPDALAVAAGDLLVVVPAVAAEERQAVGLGWIGPVVAGVAHVVVRIAAGRGLTLVHDSDNGGAQCRGSGGGERRELGGRELIRRGGDGRAGGHEGEQE